jgi:hypothetical protein
MFAPYCPTHCSRVLLGPESVRRIINHEGLIVVELDCCGPDPLVEVNGRGLASVE